MKDVKITSNSTIKSQSHPIMNLFLHMGMYRILCAWDPVIHGILFFYYGHFLETFFPLAFFT